MTVVTLPSRDQFAKTKGGAVDAESLDNIRTALRLADVDLTYDAFRREPLVNDKPAPDLTIDRLWVMLEDQFGFRPSKETLRTIVVTEADKVHVHPVRDYLDDLRWDGVPRLDRWLQTYAGAEDSAYVRSVSALPLIAAVRRVREPGEKFDELLILESTQGTDKSTALRVLCPDEQWFSDDLPLGVDSKQVIERTTGKWILEASELHGHRGREVEALKAFLSRQIDGPVRLAYGRLPVSVPRQFVIIGTTNTKIGYLKDSTGGRRFWPVQVTRFDVSALRRDRDQLWAEAAAREDDGESIRLCPDLWAAAAAQQEQRRAADPWEDLLEDLLDESDAVSVDDIWHRLGVEASYRDNRHADRVAAILQRHGFTEKRKYRGGAGKPLWHWIRSERSKERSK